MAILDGVEVAIRIQAVDRPLRETYVSGANLSSNYETLPWSLNPIRAESYVTAPERQNFSISLTLREDFDDSVGDGLHITLKLDDGQVVDHYYSIKFDEMENDESGDPTKTIPSAIVRSGTGYKSVLFSFGPTAAGTLGPLHGRILVTIVRVTHIQVGTSPMTIPQGNNLPLGANRMHLIPLADVAAVPLVDEQVVPHQTLTPTYQFLFRYKITSDPIMDLVV